MTRQANRFTFDTSFAESGDVVSDGAKARQRKVYTQGEIEQLRAEARSEGIQAGEVRALEAVAAATREVATGLRAALGASHDEIEAVREEAVQFAFAVARKLAPAALEALPVADVTLALREAIHQAIGEPRIVLRASQRVIDALAGTAADIAHDEGYEGRVVLAVDPAIRGADCRIEWRGGGAERSESAIEAALEKLITRRFSNSPNRPLEE